ncbi:MAG: hypothetical protein FWH01_02275 [Oscillospiraceae bacterium]|nr:hypothetical protein [Oscillospiraceae bacterium]
MKWNNNLSILIKEGIVGECPFCKSNNTDYTYIKKKSGRACLDIWCNDCSESEHVDCGSIPPNRKYKSIEQAIVEERERNLAKGLAD